MTTERITEARQVAAKFQSGFLGGPQRRAALEVVNHLPYSRSDDLVVFLLVGAPEDSESNWAVLADHNVTITVDFQSRRVSTNFVEGAGVGF